jgi:RimJ/RimL family protein N-acetyltransferase
VCADVDPDNIASARVFEQLGFRLEGRLRATWRTHIGVRDSLIFGLLPSDPHVWPRSPALSPGCPEADI